MAHQKKKRSRSEARAKSGSPPLPPYSPPPPSPRPTATRTPLRTQPEGETSSLTHAPRVTPRSGRVWDWGSQARQLLGWGVHEEGSQEPGGCSLFTLGAINRLGCGSLWLRHAAATPSPRVSAPKLPPQTPSPSPRPSSPADSRLGSGSSA